VLYIGVVEQFEDLKNGRVDAVLLDTPIAVFYGRPKPEVRFAGPPVGRGYYGMAVRKGDEALRKELDSIIIKLVNSGEWQVICERWGIWNKAQEELFVQIRGKGAPMNSPVEDSVLKARIRSGVPLLFKAAGMTVLISVCSMCIAIVLGALLSMLRLFGPAPFNYLAVAYIEIMRGTPLLLQLFLIYFGLPEVGLKLNAFTAAVIGLGLNYAANEAENYRAGFSSVPKGQADAALALGMTKWMTVRRILLPQAVRVSLPPMTNDFIALFKDTSLVSTITVVELTKQYSILANSAAVYIYLGTITALLYLMMSYPLSLFSRYLEGRLKKHDDGPHFKTA
jgi:polar amino acid transport system substrate-binding protein